MKLVIEIDNNTLASSANMTDECGKTALIGDAVVHTLLHILEFVYTSRELANIKSRSNHLAHESTRTFNVREGGSTPDFIDEAIQHLQRIAITGLKIFDVPVPAQIPADINIILAIALELGYRQNGSEPLPEDSELVETIRQLGSATKLATLPENIRNYFQQFVDSVSQGEREDEEEEEILPNVFADFLNSMGSE